MIGLLSVLAFAFIVITAVLVEEYTSRKTFKTIRNQREEIQKLKEQLRAYGIEPLGGPMHRMPKSHPRQKGNGR